MAIGDYTLIYPTPNVSLAALTRAALYVAGSAYVSVVSGAGSQALRVPADQAAEIYDHVGVTAEGEDIPVPTTPPGDPDVPPPGASDTAPGSDEESPGSGAAKLTAEPKPLTPAARPGGRAPGRTPAKKATKKTTTRSTGAPKKEGDDQ